MTYIVTINDKNYEVEVEKGQASLIKTEEVSAKQAQVVTEPQSQSEQQTKSSPTTVTVTSAESNSTKEGEQLKAPMPGTILDIKVTSGQKVKKGDILFILEAMKMENEIMAPNDCTVVQLYTTKGSAVSTGDLFGCITVEWGDKVFIDALKVVWLDSGLSAITWQQTIMIIVAFVLIYLAIGKKFEPLLLLPIAFGVLLANLPLAGLTAEPTDGSAGGLLYYLGLGVKLGIYPSLIFLGIGAMTDFAPLIARPSGLFLGAVAQLGIFTAFVVAIAFGFSPQEAGAIGIIGGADGPTAIYTASKLAPHLLPAITIAAYSYMALIPMIQPPLMRAITTKEEREIKMEQLREVSKLEKIIFPIIVTVFCVLLLPSVAPLIGMLMMGNLFRESGVVDRLSETAQNSLSNTVTIFLGVSVGAMAKGETFLQVETLKIIALGLFAFMMSTVGGLLLGKLMCKLSGGKINPLIGSAGVSAVPMAARVSQVEGQKANPSNYLLMHAMGPNVAGVIGSAVVAGIFLALFG